VVCRATHYRGDLFVEVISHLMMLLPTQLNDFILMDYARHWLHIARSCGTEKLHESTLMGCTDHLMNRELSLDYFGSSVFFDLLC
jgi:hypothetical protein